jgi:hypothetical protein
MPQYTPTQHNNKKKRKKNLAQLVLNQWLSDKFLRFQWKFALKLHYWFSIIVEDRKPGVDSGIKC